jgi:hypothetical protein
MDRRTVLAALAALLIRPGASRAQPTRPWRIGWLSPASASTDGYELDALRDGLRTLNLVDGRSIVIEARWGEGDAWRLPDLARSLVAANVDVICTSGTPASQAAKAATKSIPISLRARGLSRQDRAGLEPDAPRRQLDRRHVHRPRVRKAAGAAQGGLAQDLPGGAALQRPQLRQRAGDARDPGMGQDLASDRRAAGGPRQREPAGRVHGHTPRQGGGGHHHRGPAAGLLSHSGGGLRQ